MRNEMYSPEIGLQKSKQNSEQYIQFSSNYSYKSDNSKSVLNIHVL